MAVIFLIGLLIGISVTWLLELLLYKHPLLCEQVYDNPITFFGYHVHHSTVGLGCVMFALERPNTVSPYNLLVVGIGVGVIMMHTVNEGRLVFAEKYHSNYQDLSKSGS